MISTEEVKLEGDSKKYLKAVGTFAEVADYMLRNDGSDIVFFGKNGADFECVLFKRC